MIPVYEPSIEKKEKLYVNQCLDEGWISSVGRFVTMFEKKFSEYVNKKNSISVCNGTVALHLSLLAIGIKPGDEVIVPSFSYIAAINAIKYCGAKPVLVDCDIKTWQINTAEVENCITERTKAILLVHVYGGCVDVQNIMPIITKYNLSLIEDCAEALGSKFNKKHVGESADISTYSFFGNKTLTTGEGGMVSTNCSEIAKKIYQLKTQGVSLNREYFHDVLGYNYRMTNICAAIGIAQLERIEIFLKQKEKLKVLYEERLNDCPLKFQKHQKKCTSSNWMIGFRVNNNEIRDSLRKFLKYKGIDTRPGFVPAHLMPMYKIENENKKLKNSEILGETVLLLPSWPNLTCDNIDHISNSVRSFFLG